MKASISSSLRNLSSFSLGCSNDEDAQEAEDTGKEEDSNESDADDDDEKIERSRSGQRDRSDEANDVSNKERA